MLFRLPNDAVFNFKTRAQQWRAVNRTFAPKLCKWDLAGIKIPIYKLDKRFWQTNAQGSAINTKAA